MTERTRPVPTLRSYAAPAEQQDAILEAARAEFTQVGVRRANMDYIAKSAGVSRSTLYRRFANKDALLAALVAEIQTNILDRLIAVIRGRDLQAVIVECFVEVVGLLRRDPLLRRLRGSEPESIQAVALSGGGTIVSQAFAEYSAAVARTLAEAGATMPEADLLAGSELMVRITTSYVETASTFVDLDKPERAREFATAFLAPLIW